MTVRICFMGDSETKGAVGTLPPGGFRGIVWEYVHEDYDVQMVGSQTEGFNSIWDHHEGYGGYGIGGSGGGPAPQVYDVVPDLADIVPDIVVLLVGVNDMVQAWSDGTIRSTMVTRMGALLDLIHATVPDALVAVCTLPYVDFAVWTSNGSSDADRLAFNAGLPGLVATRSWTALVDLEDALVADDTTDGLHPDLGGNTRIARVITDALTGEDGFLRTLAPPPEPVEPDEDDLVLLGGGLIEEPSPLEDASSVAIQVWCLGDDNVEGGTSGGFRPAVKSALTSMGYTPTLVGTLLGQDTPATFHDGHIGATVADLREIVASYQEDIAPDVVLLLVGTNDLVSTTPLLSRRHYVATSLLRLVDEIRAGSGTPFVAVAALPPVDVAAGSYRTDVPGLVSLCNEQARAAVKRRSLVDPMVAWVDADLTTADLADGHVLDAGGYSKLAYAYLQAVPWLTGMAVA